MEQTILTEAEKEALLAQDDEEIEKEIRKQGKKEKGIFRKDNLIKWLTISLITGAISLPIGLRVGYNYKTREIEKDLRGIYAEAQADAKKIYNEAIKNSQLGVRNVSTLSTGKNLLRKLESDGVISNFGLMSRDEDGLVYAVFDTNQEELKKIIADPEKYDFQSDKGKEKLYSTLKDSLKDNNGQFIIEFNQEGNISNIYEADTGLSINY